MRDSLPHLKVAFTTNSLTWIDADIVGARHVVLYDVTPDQATFLDAHSFHPPADGGTPRFAACLGPGEAPQPGGHLAAKLMVLKGRGLLFTAGLTERTAMQVASAGTFPVVVEQRRAIDHVLSRLRTLIRHDPPLWLCRVLRYSAHPVPSFPPDLSTHDNF